MSKLLEQINNTKTTKRLGDLVLINQSSITNGFSYREIEYIDTASVTRNHFDRPQILNINEAPSRAKRLLKDGDTILSTVRPSLCHYGFIKNPKPNTVASTGFAVLTPKNIDPFYLYSYLTQDSITTTLSSIAEATTTTFPAFRPEVLSEMEIDVPDLPTQKKIADILSAYDSKIENNNKIIKNLEATAQTIFNEWFVNFRFPGYEKVKMVESEMGEIPEGWEIFNLKDIFTFVKGKKPAEVSEIQKEGFLQQILIDSFENGKKLYADKKGMVIASEQDLLMVMDGASSGRIEFGITGIVGSTISKLELKKPIRSILYFFLKTKEKDIKDNTTGSAIPHTDKEKVYSYKIVLPKKTDFFEEILLGFIQGIEKLNQENIKLKESRNQLLDKLI
ncbi:MAG: restriction endonuclease subunit S [Candidatus Paceibacterota bacterium]